MLILSLKPRIAANLLLKLSKILDFVLLLSLFTGVRAETPSYFPFLPSFPLISFKIFSLF
jgi:hypothetical protein